MRAIVACAVPTLSSTARSDNTGACVTVWLTLR